MLRRWSSPKYRRSLRLLIVRIAEARCTRWKPYSRSWQRTPPLWRCRSVSEVKAWPIYSCTLSCHIDQSCCSRCDVSWAPGNVVGWGEVGRSRVWSSVGYHVVFTGSQSCGMFLLRDGLVSLVELYSGLGRRSTGGLGGRRSTVLAPEDWV